jgi:hypothetical protein
MACVDSLHISMVFLTRFTVIACHERPTEICAHFHYALYTAFIWISDYLTSCLALFNVLLEIFITLERLYSVTNLLPSTKSSTKIIVVSLVIFIISFTVYTPVLFMDHVEMKLYQDPEMGFKQYQLGKTAFGKSQAASIIMNSINIFRVFLFSFVLFILNLITVVRLKRHLLRRRAQHTTSNFTAKLRDFLFIMLIFIIFFLSKIKLSRIDT